MPIINRRNEYVNMLAISTRSSIFLYPVPWLRDDFSVQNFDKSLKGWRIIDGAQSVMGVIDDPVTAVKLEGGGTLGRPHNQNRDAGPADDTLGHTSHDPSAHAGTAMGGHNNQIRFLMCVESRDIFCSFACNHLTW